MGLSDLKKFAIHEIIHHLQEVIDDDNTLIRMGLLEFNKSKAFGMGLNEATVQIISSYILRRTARLCKILWNRAFNYKS